MRNKALEVLLSSIYRSMIHISFFLYSGINYYIFTLFYIFTSLLVLHLYFVFLKQPWCWSPKSLKSVPAPYCAETLPSYFFIAGIAQYSAWRFTGNPRHWSEKWNRASVAANRALAGKSRGAMLLPWSFDSTFCIKAKGGILMHFLELPETA